MSLPWPRRKIQLARLLGVQLPGNANVALRNSTSNSSSKEMCDDSEMREREREREAEAEVERECAEGVVLDRLSHGSSVIGRTSKTAEVDALRFGDQDLSVLGTLEAGQFGVVDVVSCALDGRVYVRKSVEKIFVARHREQCSPQYERDLLLAARATRASWAPHLLCAYQTPTHLRLVMDYLAGGTLWDVLESSPADMRVGERDVKWWAPQMVCAIDWCHAQGFAHRDIKPHNFVLTASRHLQLIDFGSAAPLLPPDPHGTRFIPKQYCMVPCGTCDYISPEILQSYEEALLALEVSDDEDEGSRAYEDESSVEHEREDTWDASRTVGRKKGRRKGNGDRGGGGEGLGYGCETDWWSMGAMLYEMVYGVAPFFASDVKTTYLRIMDHETSLRFNRAIDVSAGLQDLIRRLLTHPEIRLGRHSVLEISEHPFFEDTNWATLEYDSAPDDLLVPEFTYFAPNGTGVLAANLDRSTGSDASQPFAFSALFQSSIITEPSHLNRSSGSSPGLSGLQNSQNASGQKAWIGFSWGPMADAFNHDGSMSAQDLDPSLFQAAPRAPDQTEGDSAWVDQLTTPRPAARPSAPTPSAVPRYGTFAGFPSAGAGADPASPSSLFRTPVRTPFNTFPRTAPRTATTTLRRTAQRREVSDREAMRQLVDCVGMSARKKVLASGRKPRILDSVVRARTRGRGREARERSGSGSASSSAVAVPALLPRSALRPASGGGRVVSASAGNTVRFAPPERERAPSRNLAPIFTASAAGAMAGRIAVNASGTTDSSTRSLSLPDAYGYGLGGLAGLGGDGGGGERGGESESETSESEGPPSPSPSPRPSSAMSTLSGGLRSATPSVTSTMGRGARSATPSAMLNSGVSLASSSGSRLAASAGPTMGGRARSGSGSQFLAVPPSAPENARGHEAREGNGIGDVGGTLAGDLSGDLTFEPQATSETRDDHCTEVTEDRIRPAEKAVKTERAKGKMREADTSAGKMSDRDEDDTIRAHSSVHRQRRGQDPMDAPTHHPPSRIDRQRSTGAVHAAYPRSRSDGDVVVDHSQTKARRTSSEDDRFAHMDERYAMLMGDLGRISDDLEGLRLGLSRMRASV